MTERIVVTVNEGRIRGIKNKSVFSDEEFYSFYGVPYGQPTSNQARYKDPVKVKPWKNIYDATVQKQGCVQYSHEAKQIVGSEDCLYNSIHTPKLPSVGDPLKAVIVNIHPGAFLNGSPDAGSPDYIMHHDIVYVSVGYRLHVLGFLNLGMKGCSGNQGLKDIILGLKWIRDNIRVFAGDPDNVTLLGNSGGGTLVHCLMLSPAAKGLFCKAIIMCSYLFNPVRQCWDEHVWLAAKIARALGNETADENDKKKLHSFYRKLYIPAFLLYHAEKLLDKNLRSSFPCSFFNPTIDTGEQAVLPVNPRELIDSTARIPLMIGICEKEAAMGFCRGMKDVTMHNFKTAFRQNSWGWARHMTDDQTDAMFEEIKSFYLNGGDITDAPLSVLVDIQTDGAYSELYESLIDVISDDLPSSAYVYKFQFESNGDVNTLKDQISFLLDEPLDGTFHGCDISYWACMLQKHEIESVKDLSPRTRKTIETFTKLSTTFAKTGDPNYQELDVEWKPSTRQNPCYMNINDSLDLVDGKLNDERMRFWEDLIKRYGEQ